MPHGSSPWSPPQSALGDMGSPDLLRGSFSLSLQESPGLISDLSTW